MSTRDQSPELAQLRAQNATLKALLRRCQSALDGEALADQNFKKPLDRCGAWLELRKEIEEALNPAAKVIAPWDNEYNLSDQVSAEPGTGDGNQ
jgi:hypothetical protein